MVAVIKSGSSLHRIFNYNENKVKEGVARCLLAENYPIETADLTLHQKLNRLLNQSRLNENVKRNGIHISLNFPPGEVVAEEKLKQIARAYMDGIGFGEQPYLVYQHHDAAHPHLHIISTKIRSDGKRIDTQNIGRNKSEPIRKSLEIQFGLVKAEDHKKSLALPLEIENIPATYGQLPTKSAIGKVLNQVLLDYKYTSIPELNAVLKSYGVMADRGGESSRVYQKKGLYYRLIDHNGTKTGVPIKASLFHQNPGLKFLFKRFLLNESRRKPDRMKLRLTVDQVLKNPPDSMGLLAKALKSHGVELVIRQNEQGLVYGLTYVDHRSKSVFNGSALGKKYSAKAVLGVLATAVDHTVKKQTLRWSDHHPEERDFSHVETQNDGLLTQLLQAEESYEPIPYPLKKARRKRKKRRIHQN